MRRYSCCKRSTKASINTSVGLNIRRLPRPGVSHGCLHVTLHSESDRHPLNRMRFTITLRWCCSHHKIKAQSLSFDVFCPCGYRLSQVPFREAVGAYYSEAPRNVTVWLRRRQTAAL